VRPAQTDYPNCRFLRGPLPRAPRALSTATTIAPLPCFHADNLPPHLFTLEVESPVR
jgi:hypothetical protein